MPSPSVVVVVVCDDTSDELDDSEFRDVFRCKVNLVLYSSDVAAAFFSEILWQFKRSFPSSNLSFIMLLKHNLGFDIYIKHKSWRYRKLLTTNEGSAEGLLMSGVRCEGSGGGSPGGRERPAGRNGGEAAELEADDELSIEECFKSGRE